MDQWNKNYNSINLQVGTYNLCYRKLAIFSCPKVKNYPLKNSSNRDFTLSADLKTSQMKSTTYSQYQNPQH